MAWNDPSETIVGNGGEAYTAPVGTALPAKTSDVLNNAFFGLGFHTEDGITTNLDRDIQEYMAWQSKSAIRRELNTTDFQCSFTLLQWNEVSLPFAMGGGTVTETSTGFYKYTPPLDTDALQERSLVVDIDDGSRRVRFVVPRGTVTDVGEMGFKRGEMTGLSVTFKALAPTDGSSTPSWYPLFNDAAAFAAGS